MFFSEPGESLGQHEKDVAFQSQQFVENLRWSASGVQSIALAIQADMWDPAFAGVNDSPASYDHFTAFVQELVKLTLGWGKPVLLLNGDSHIFVDDRPLSAAAPVYQKTMYGLTRSVPNLRRITINGSTTPCHEWLKLTMDQSTTGVFSYDRLLFHNQPGFDPAVC